jgi:hypothetical protein
MPNNRSIWLILVSTVLFLGAAFVTLRAAEQASRRPAPASAAGQATPASAPVAPRAAVPTTTGHPPPAAPEESAAIADDPTTAPDPSQSADNNVSFPNDI